MRKHKNTARWRCFLRGCQASPAHLCPRPKDGVRGNHVVSLKNVFAYFCAKKVGPVAARATYYILAGAAIRPRHCHLISIKRHDISRLIKHFSVKKTQVLCFPQRLRLAFRLILNNTGCGCCACCFEILAAGGHISASLEIAAIYPARKKENNATKRKEPRPVASSCQK